MTGMTCVGIIYTVLESKLEKVKCNSGFSSSLVASDVRYARHRAQTAQFFKNKNDCFIRFTGVVLPRFVIAY